MPGEAAQPEYDPQADVQKVAAHFVQKYGSLEKALANLGPDSDFDLCTFEATLKKWGVQVENVVELFGHIDLDCSDTVSVRELFEVLELPVQEAQQREVQRQKNEVKRVYAELAKRIRRDYGSIAEYFRQRNLVEEGGARADLSVARFRKLVTELGLDLDAPQLQRVFREMDEDGTGSVSMLELQKALNFNLVRDILAELAGALLDTHGSVTAPFEDVAQEMMSGERSTSKGSPMKPTVDAEPGPGPSPGTPQPAAGGAKPGEMTEAGFLRIWGKLKVADKFSDDTAKQLHAALRPFTIEALIENLQKAEADIREARRREKEEEKRRERELKKRAAKGFNSRQRAEGEVQAWAEARLAAVKDHPPTLLAAQLAAIGAHNRHSPAAAPLPGGAVEDATRAWSERARAGACRAQLKDYIAVLEKAVDEREEQLQMLSGQIRKAEEEAENLQDYLGFHPRWSTDGTPTSPGTPYTPYLTPGSRVGATPRSPGPPLIGNALAPESRTARAERLVQAATTGDVDTIQRLLALRTDVDAVAWGGVTPLMAAARHARQAALECLLARGGDLTRTDVRGRTALDHAYKRPAMREYLRHCGARTGKELAAEAEALAQRVLMAGAEQARLEALRKQLPSEDVLRQARLRRQLASQDPLAGAGDIRPSWPHWTTGASPIPSYTAPPFSGATPWASPHPTSCLAATSSRAQSKARSGKHVTVALPTEAMTRSRDDSRFA